MISATVHLTLMAYLFGVEPEPIRDMALGVRAYGVECQWDRHDFILARERRRHIAAYKNPFPSSLFATRNPFCLSQNVD